MKKKVRFNSLEIGDSFEWNTKTMKKIGLRRGEAQYPRQEFIFSYNDIVLVESLEEDTDDDIVDGFGYIQDPYFSGNWIGTTQTP